MTTAETLESRIADGATLLDGIEPGWYDGVDLASLDMGNSLRDVLGQLFGSFYEGVEALNAFVKGSISAFRYGFCWSVLVDGDNDSWKEEATELWLRAILKRREDRAC